ncbi:hypothetical protein LTR20_010816 [Exophiala xenobiotica]|nr:hypothetical protein LTS06_011164 [Exophiala xenobiotica]KAK5259769.1 hypothetical protein LTR40_005369 [Exophiala xenobiotica]KAK5358851.1 hypothetical protein LTS13_010849 [Exophiala xenobiotica]KAK5400977.1 hypothetical protein LTR79_001496 [Exophiala xenobiotica]KAK5408906.1 hypothetical protein LTR90_009029 [Exophiala xenobiotica]
MAHDYASDKDLGHPEIKTSPSGHAQELDFIISDFSDTDKARIQRKIDLRLVLPLGLGYTICLIDRGNTGLLAVSGLITDLNLIGYRYQIIILLFFPTYILIQPVATALARKVGPRALLPVIIFAWGLSTLCMGFVKYWWQMLPLRALLGLFEGGYFPTCTFLLSCWYPRYELQKRNSGFYFMGMIASAFGGILAYGLSQLKGHGSGAKYLGQHYGPTATDPEAPSGILPGLSGWRWILIIEGAITCVIGIILFVFVVDFPDRCKTNMAIPFLKPHEIDYVCARLNKDRDDVEPTKFSLKTYLANTADPLVWAYCLTFLCTSLIQYALSYFLPIILQDSLGFGVAASQLMSAPPYVCAAALMFAQAWWGDKHQLRSPIVVVNALFSVLGLCMLAFTKPVASRYIGAVILTACACGNTPPMITWQANNIRGQWKRALCSASLLWGAGLGGVTGSLVFRTQDKPTYRPGIATCLTAAGIQIVLPLLMVLYFRSANKRAREGRKTIEGLPGFLYTL